MAGSAPTVRGPSRRGRGAQRGSRRGQCGRRASAAGRNACLSADLLLAWRQRGAGARRRHCNHLAAGTPSCAHRTCPAARTRSSVAIGGHAFVRTSPTRAPAPTINPGTVAHCRTDGRLPNSAQPPRVSHAALRGHPPADRTQTTRSSAAQAGADQAGATQTGTQTIARRRQSRKKVLRPLAARR